MLDAYYAQNYAGIISWSLAAGQVYICMKHNSKADHLILGLLGLYSTAIHKI